MLHIYNIYNNSHINNNNNKKNINPSFNKHSIEHKTVNIIV